jgi:hypothetical protein
MERDRYPSYSDGSRSRRREASKPRDHGRGRGGDQSQHRTTGPIFRAGSRVNLRYGEDDSLDYGPDPNRRKNNSRKQEGQPASSRQPLNTGGRKKGDLSKVQAGTLTN